MTTPTGWRALCAELLEALEIQLDELASTNRLCKRARAALAQSTPEGVITFHESRDEVIRIDSQGFHYRSELIEDAGQAHQLMMTFLQRHTLMHPEVVEQEAAQPQPEEPIPESELADMWNQQADLFNQWESLDSGEQLEWAQARAIARWGRPAIKPVPLSERLPGPEDCDAEGHCWLFRVALDGVGDWHQKKPHPSAESSQFFRETHWLPHWALPVPVSGQDA